MKLFADDELSARLAAADEDMDRYAALRHTMPRQAPRGNLNDICVYVFVTVFLASLLFFCCSRQEEQTAAEYHITPNDAYVQAESRGR